MTPPPCLFTCDVTSGCQTAAKFGNKWSRVIALNNFEREGTGHISSVNALKELPLKCLTVKTLGVHCQSDVCSVIGGHSAGCRTSWVRLQHHATVVTSNGVTICGSKFPPTVSKHYQHQHILIPKNHNSKKKYQQSQLLWYPRCCFLTPTSWQPLYIANSS